MEEDVVPHSVSKKQLINAISNADLKKKIPTWNPEIEFSLK